MAGGPVLGRRELAGLLRRLQAPAPRRRAATAKRPTAEARLPPARGAEGRTRRRPRSPQPASAGDPERSPAGASARAARRRCAGAAALIVKNMEASLAVPTATSARVIPAGLLEVNRRVANNYLVRVQRQGKISFTHLIGWAVVRACSRCRS